MNVKRYTTWNGYLFPSDECASVDEEYVSLEDYAVLQAAPSDREKQKGLLALADDIPAILLFREEATQIHRWLRREAYELSRTQRDASSIWAFERKNNAYIELGFYLVQCGYEALSTAIERYAAARDALADTTTGEVQP